MLSLTNNDERPYRFEVCIMGVHKNNVGKSTREVTTKSFDFYREIPLDLFLVLSKNQRAERTEKE